MNYRMEINRLKTFKDWPVIFISKNVMATAGFYYIGKGSGSMPVLRSADRELGAGRRIPLLT
jgi:hypothetical protein